MKTSETERLSKQMSDFFRYQNLRTDEENDILRRELKMQNDAYKRKQNENDPKYQELKRKQNGALRIVWSRALSNPREKLT